MDRRHGDEERKQATEQVTETTLQRTRIRREERIRNHLDSLDSDIPHIEWRTMDRYIKPSSETGTSSSSPPGDMPKLVSFWDLMGAERTIRKI